MKSVSWPWVVSTLSVTIRAILACGSTALGPGHAPTLALLERSIWGRKEENSLCVSDTLFVPPACFTHLENCIARYDAHAARSHSPSCWSRLRSRR